MPQRALIPAPHSPEPGHTSAPFSSDTELVSPAPFLAHNPAGSPRATRGEHKMIMCGWWVAIQVPAASARTLLDLPSATSEK